MMVGGLVINRMGSQQSMEVECEEMRQGEWEEDTSEREAVFGRCRTLRNRRTGAMVDEYQLSWVKDHEFSFYLKSFNWRVRCRSHAPVVSARFFKPLCRADLCSHKFAASVYLQHIRLRLSNLEEVPMGEALYVLVEALQGYAQLYEHSGYFRVREEQICVDCAGRVKVWVNADLSKNYPECDTDCGHNQKDQVDMVEQLLQVISAATDPEQMPTPSLFQFFDFTRRRQEVSIGFEYAKVLAFEFAKHHQIRIPTRFETVLELLAPASPIHKNYSVSNYPQTLPSSIELVHPRSACLPSSPRLNYCHSMPSIHHPESISTISHLPPPTYVPPQPQPLLQMAPPLFNSREFAAEVQQSLRLEEIQSRRQEEESNGQQTKRKSGNSNSKNSKNSKSQMINPNMPNFDQASHTQSIHFNESLLEDRNTMRSVPNRRQVGRRPNFGEIHYSQCIGETYQQRNYGASFNQDGFGMVPRRRRIQQSSSSNRFLSSNSSQRNSHKHSKKSGSSRRDSAMNRQASTQAEALPLQMPKRPLQFYSIVGEEWQLDPEIEADIRKYLGE